MTRNFNNTLSNLSLMSVFNLTLLLVFSFSWLLDFKRVTGTQNLEKTILWAFPDLPKYTTAIGTHNNDFTAVITNEGIK